MQNNLALTLMDEQQVDMLSDDDICQSVVTRTLDPEDTLSEASSTEWQNKVLSTLKELVLLPENWDSYGARKIDPRNADYAFDLIGMLMTPNLPLPLIVPTNSGSIQLEWHNEGVDLEIKILSANKINVYFDLEPYRDWEGVITYDLEPLGLFIDELVEK